MQDDDFQRLLEDYLDPPAELNQAMEDVVIRWIEDDPDVGVLHMWNEHHVTREEILQVLLEVPPEVEVRRHPEHPNRTIFWGATRQDRQLFIVCEDEHVNNMRRLTPITAYTPDEGQAYWDRQR